MSLEPADIAAQRLRMGLGREELIREAAVLGGRWTETTTLIPVTDPFSGLPIGHVPDVGREGALTAVEAASRAFPEWRAQTGAERGRILRDWHDLVLTQAIDLARLLTAEQGKPLAEAQGEIAYAASFIAWFAEEARRVDGEIITPPSRDRRIFVQREPVGVVAAITPWNFPAAMVTRKLAPALAAGCTVVLKPSELTPFTALALAFLAEQAGVPAGVINVVTGRPEPIGEVLSTDPRVRKLTFTGSTPVGRHLAEMSSRTVKRLSLELGGDAPFIVFADADLEAAVDGLIASKFRNAGQTCVCANRVLIDRRIAEPFTSALAERVSSMKVGDGLAAGTQIGPLIDARAIAKVNGLVDKALQAGALVSAWSPSIAPLVSPMVLSGIRPEMEIARTEIFGPIAAIMTFDQEADAVSLANRSEAGLAAYFYTRDLARTVRVAEALEAGMVGVNTGAISSEVIPFGGVKQSGYGREGSRHGLDDYLSLKATCIAI
jgi:succinate-semialdehyde dehydrogenase/glutarate-semialdehyde dehydrogenase